MNILQINASYKPAYTYGGPTMSVSRLSEQLTRKGYPVQVFTTTANGRNELPIVKNFIQQVDGVPVRYFKRITKDHSHFSPALLLALWKEVRSFNIVHIHAWWNLVSVLSCAIAIVKGVPVVLSPRGTLSRYSFTVRHSLLKGLFHKAIGAALLNRCYLHATSGAEQEALCMLLRPKGIFTIHNAINLPVYIPERCPEAKVLKLLFFSRIDPKKGLELLFQALAGIPIPYQLSIAGTGDETYVAGLKKLSRQYQIDQNLNWLGFKQNNKFEVLARHHLLVLPSYDENFGNVVIESLSTGTAVLISKEVGLSRYVAEHNLGWVCETNAESIRKQLTAIYFQRGSLNVIREFAPVMVAREFNDDKLISQYQEMYREILGHNA